MNENSIKNQNLETDNRTNQPRTFKTRPAPLEVCLDRKNNSEYFNEILVGRFTRISFHRTLRVPEDGRNYPLPAGLGRFPIHRVEEFSKTVPISWLAEGGYFIPLYQKEALFIQLEGVDWHPTIAKINVGGINAISGKPYSELLSKSHQDYVVVPQQKWLDGVCSGEGLIRQFVAMPLGQGFTIEAQVTNEEEFGGFQIVVMDAKDGRFSTRDPNVDRRAQDGDCLYAADLFRPEKISMGIAAGGAIKQQIQKDTYGSDSWNPEKKRKLTIHLVNSMAYKAITGFEPPPSPITLSEYQQAKIPWYSHYEDTTPSLKPPSIFKRLIGVSALEKKRGVIPSADEISRLIAIHNIHKIRTPDKIEASQAYRKRASDSFSLEWWEIALREISYVIDLDVSVTSKDYALRSCCNYQMGRFMDGVIDGTLGLKISHDCIESLSWRAFCWKSIGDHQNLSEDAVKLINNPSTELIGLELKAESSLLAKNYIDAWDDAMTLKIKYPGHKRADEIVSEANIKMFGVDFDQDHEF